MWLWIFFTYNISDKVTTYLFTFIKRGVNELEGLFSGMEKNIAQWFTRNCHDTIEVLGYRDGEYSKMKLLFLDSFTYIFMTIEPRQEFVKLFSSSLIMKMRTFTLRAKRNKALAM